MTPECEGVPVEQIAEYIEGLQWDIGGDRVLMLRAIADESFDGGNVMTMAGFLAPLTSWREVWYDWKAVLDRKDFGVSAFHAADCEAAEGLFEGWEQPRIAALQTELLAVLTDGRFGTEAPLGYSVSLPIKRHASLRQRLKAFLTLRPGGAINGSLDHPWFFAFQGFIASVLNDCSALAPDELISFVFDQTKEFQGRAPAVFGSLLDMPKYGPRMDGLSFRDHRRIVPLQCADLLAYETQIYFRDTHLHGKPERWQHLKIRPSVRAAHWFSGESLEDIVSATEADIERKKALGLMPERPMQRPRRRRPSDAS